VIIIRGSGDCERAEAQAARLLHLAKELDRDLAHWKGHLDPAAVEEATLRIARHRSDAGEWSALVEAFHREPRVLPAHFADEAGDELGMRVGG